MNTLRASLELVKEQMEQESKQKVENLIQKHRAELGKCNLMDHIYIYCCLMSI